MSKLINKEYKYINAKGKEVIVKRQYKITGSREAKKNELDEYFKNNIDFIKSNNLNKVLEDYNEDHDNKISYSMIYQRYKVLFGFRKNHSTAEPQVKYTEKQMRKKINKETKQKEQQMRENVERLREKAAQRREQEKGEQQEEPDKIKQD